MLQLSVVIPTYNRPGPLRRCLEALAHQNVPVSDWEVIVSDDGSRTDIAASLDDFRAPYRLTVLRHENAGPGAARNRGVLAAQGRFCLFLDDDTVPDPGVVAAHLDAQHQYGGAVGVGKLTTLVEPGADWFARSLAQRRDRHYARLDAGGYSPRWVDCYSGNLSVPRDRFLAQGGFAVDLPRAEDVELAFRLERAGLPLAYVPNAHALVFDSKRLPDLARDLERSGEAAVLLVRRHPLMHSDLLGHLGDKRQRRILRGMLTLGLPAHVSALFAQIRWREEDLWQRDQFFSQYCYWRGIQRALRGDRNTWYSLTQVTTTWGMSVRFLKRGWRRFHRNATIRVGKTNPRRRSHYAEEWHEAGRPATGKADRQEREVETVGGRVHPRDALRDRGDRRSGGRA